MFPLLQAVRLESAHAQVTRYMVVVSTNGRQDTEESVVLGMDFSPVDRWDSNICKHVTACLQCTVHTFLTWTFFPSQLVFYRAGFAFMEWHFDTSWRRWVRKTSSTSWFNHRATTCHETGVLRWLTEFVFFALCSVSSCSQGFQCVNWQQSTCFQACFCAGHVVSHTT